MEEVVTYFKDPVHVSASAAAISAICALLTFLIYLLSRRPSRREMVDILKIEILKIVSSVERREIWIKMVTLSQTYEGEGIGPKVDRIAEFIEANTEAKLMSKLQSVFKSKYKKTKWLMLIPVAVEELKKEGYDQLLGIGQTHIRRGTQ